MAYSGELEETDVRGQRSEVRGRWELREDVVGNPGSVASGEK